MKKYDAALFDFDGTTADTGLGVKNCVKYSLDYYGIDVGDENKLNEFIGPSLYTGYTEICGVDDETANKLVEKYRERYKSVGIYECSPYEGIKELFEKLRKSGVKVAIASSKPKVFLEKCIMFLTLDQSIDYFIGPSFSDTSSDKKSLLCDAAEHLKTEKSKCIMIGDRKYDIDAASALGIDSIGVTYGYGSVDELNKSGATYTACNTKEIKKIILG